MIRVHLLLVILAILAQASAFASVPKREIKLVSFPIPLMVESKSKGLFIDVVKEVERRSGLRFSITVLPAPRAIKGFAKGEYDALFPGLDILFPKIEKVLRSDELLYVKKDYVFTRKNSALITDIHQLEGLLVGLTRSYPYAQKITQNANIRRVQLTTDELNAQMLAYKRTDAFIVEESSGLQAFKSTGLLSEVHYPEDSPISEQDVYFAFHATALGQQLERLFSNALATMKKDGQFDAIMSSAVRTGLEKPAYDDAEQTTHSSSPLIEKKPLD